MAIERMWESISPRVFVEDGSENGLITLDSTIRFRVGMKVSISTTNPNVENKNLVVKRVLSSTQMFVGPNDKNIKSRSDITAFTVGEIAMISVTKQDKTQIPEKDQLHMTLEREPVNARRVFQVDDFGNPIGTTPENPLNVQLVGDSSIEIDTMNAELEVQLSRKDNNPDTGDVHDSVRLGNQDYELTYTANDDESKAAADVLMLNRIIDVPHDDIQLSYNDNGDIETVELLENTNTKLRLGLFYNDNGDLIRVGKI